MIRTELRRLLDPFAAGEEVKIDPVPRGKPGDYATNLALRLAAKTGGTAESLAQEIINRLNDPMIAEAVLVPPGFINITISREHLAGALDRPPAFAPGHGQRVNVEFVSANPVGPLNVVSARAAAVGDSLVRIFNYAGYRADAEYYVNDSGRQIEMLAASLNARMEELDGHPATIPEDGYHGTYLIALARRARGSQIAGEALKRFAVDHFIADHRRTLEGFGVTYANWVRESQVRELGHAERVLARLREQGLTFEQDGALFFRATALGDTRDRVIVTREQRYTYLLPDIGYHLYKIERGYEHLITLLGPDHHGQVKSLHAGLKAFGHPEAVLTVKIVQEVKLKKDGAFLSMSKRQGTFMTMDELLTRLRRDVVRFFLLMRSCSQPLDFDLDLAARESDENPVFYVQYAHARICSIIKHAAERGVKPGPSCRAAMTEPEEQALVRQLLRFNETIEDIIFHRDPYLMTYYLLELARMFHAFYQQCRVVSDDAAVSAARLNLVVKTAATLRTGLTLLGISSPEKM